MMPPETLKSRLIRRIETEGPMGLDEYMALCLGDRQDGYYPQAGRLGPRGDFITSPEISQMFGELLGLWLALWWQSSGSPAPLPVVELGPGNGVMMADMRRAARAVPAFAEALVPLFYETSPALRAEQRKHHPDAQFIDRLVDAPKAPVAFVGNEFLDALPVQQFTFHDGRWLQRLVGHEDGVLRPVIDPHGPDAAALLADRVPDTPPKEGDILEVAIAAEGVIAEVAAHIKSHGGVALFIDYGSAAAKDYGSSLQAIAAHQRVDPFADPGNADVTAHVPFARLATVAERAGVKVAPVLTQGAFLMRMGLGARAQALTEASPADASKLGRVVHRLTAPDEMGELFKVIALVPSAMPLPPVFQDVANERKGA
ncbi:MAG: SAM-dependent methyltransferase [Pseudomonadota bacterium]